MTTEQLAPWQDGWRVNDPLRPCYTCGAARVGIARDGGPIYPATCLHQPARPDPATLDFREYGPISVTLTEAEMRRAIAHALKVMAVADEQGYKMKFVTNEGRLAVNIRGFAAELAASRVTGLPLNWKVFGAGYTRRRKSPDIGQRVEVRNAIRPDGPLVGYHREHRDWYYLLVTGAGPSFKVVGWAHGHELHHPDNLDVEYDRFSLSQDELHPVADLPADA